jgi:hypothetical protein
MQLDWQNAESICYIYTYNIYKMQDQLKITPAQVRNMSDAEFEDFRQEHWNKKRNEYSSGVKSWFLNSKPNYIEFVKQINEKNARFGKPNIGDVEEIQSMTSEQWEDFRQKKWLKQGEKYKSEIAPTWYLNSKEKYAEFLERSFRK